METEELIVGNKRVFICEEHHHVLKFWQEFKDLQPYVLTFDHHTDLLLTFQKELYNRNSKSKYPTPEACEAERDRMLGEVASGDFEAIKKLYHDEHVDTAVKAGIIKKALVYADGGFYSRPKDVYGINGDEDYDGQLIISNDRSPGHPNSVIETKELEYNFRRFDLCLPREEWLGNFILDIDLDYFMTTKSIKPKNSNFFKMLIRKALVITVAKESGWVSVWQREYDKNLTVDYLLKELFKLIESASEEPI